MRGIVYDGEKTAVVEGLELRKLGPREVIVDVVAAGVCHSDLSFMSGLYPVPTPAVCGHEGAGIVAQVGDAVTHVKPGDHVVIATIAACGFCEFCMNGRPTSCRQSMGNAVQPFILDGTPLFNFAMTSVFADQTLIRDVQAVKIPDDVPLTSAALVGCGVTTGMGAVLNRANVQIGDTAAVFGVGGVGLNSIQALKVKRARRIIAVDTVPEKEAIARQFGATDFIDGRRDDVVEAICALEPFSDDEIRGPFNAGGVDWAFDCVAIPPVTHNAFESLDWGGTLVVIGVSGMTTEFSGLYQRLTQVDRGIIGTRAGTISPQRDIPMIIDLYRRGEVLLDELVSVTYPMAEYEEVLHAMEAGTIARRLDDVKAPLEGSFTTTLDVFDAVLATAPDAEAFVDGDDRITFVEWAARADGVAAHLADRGVTRGDVVCFQLTSCIDYAIAYQAVMRLGAITSGVNPRLGRAEVESIITRAEPKVVITDAGLVDAAPIPAGPWQVIDRQVVRDAPPGDPLVRRVQADATDTVAIVWTSGTTGVPKGAVFDHECLRATADCAGVISAPGDRRISPLPFAHVGSMTRVWDELVNVICTLITPSPWNAGQTLRLMERERATVGQGVPTMWTLMMVHPDLPGTDLSSLRIAGTGAARVPPELVRDMRAKLGCPVVVRYASTEASLSTGTDPGDDVETVANTVGRPPKGIELRIADVAGGEVATGEVGTVWLRSRAVMRGYWRDPEQTAKVITSDGWLVTGDLGWVGDDGDLRLVGRHAEMYIRGGYNVYPGEVENTIGEHPAIASVAVLGGAVPVLGEIGVAFVVPAVGHDAPTLDELRAFVGDRLADYKAPDIVIRVDALPLTSMGKVDKQVLKPRAAAAAESWVRPARRT